MQKNYFYFNRTLMFMVLLACSAAFHVQAQVTQTLSYTGAMQTFTVPSCVTTITMDVRGAEGGDANGTTVGFGAGSMSISGGDGGRVVATLTVIPGEVLSVFIGGKGTPSAGGFNGGGSPASCSGTEVLAAGGGGASDIRRTGVAFTDRIIVAGGGGGAAGAASSGYLSVPGAGGGLTGGAGTGGTGACLLGLGGTQSSGGAGGSNIGCSCNLTNVAGSGSVGIGGGSICAPSGLSTCGNPCSGVGCCTGGGGGAGYYGGGAGVARASAGGGSSYVEPTATSVTHTQGFQTGNGSIILTYNFSGPVVSTTTTPSAICTGGTATLSASGLVSYTWSPGGSSATSITVAPTANTTYTVRGTNSLGCISTGLVPVNVNSAAPVLTVSTSTTSICPTNTVMITATGALSYTIANSGVSNGVAFSPAATAVYTISGSNGCGITTANVTITVTPLPVTASASSTLICSGSPATLTAGGATTYTWQPGTLTQTTPVVSPLANTVYTVTGQTGSCFGIAMLSISTKTLPVISILASDTTLCYGTPGTLNAIGDAVTYSWNPGGPGASISINPTNTSVYTLTGTNVVNCTRSVSKIIVVNSNPVVSIAASDTEVCSGGSSTLTASGTHTYSWSNSAHSSTIVVNPAHTETFTVTGTNTLTECFTATAITVNVFEPAITVSSNTTICLGANITLGASGGVTYTWTNNSTIGPAITVSPITNTTYTVVGSVLSQNALSCNASAMVDVSVFTPPVITAVTNHTAICRGTTASLTADGAGAAGTYTWSSGLGSTPIISVAPILNQLYTVTGTDANGCKGTATVQVIVDGCTGIANIAAATAKLSIYPNPSSGEFTITSDQSIELQITNELGQEVRKISLKANGKAMVTSLSNGIYFIMGKNENGSVKEKIVVSK